MNDYRILADSITASNDGIESQLNSNTAVVGAPGSGKTRSVLLPNILQTALAGCRSMVIADVKGTLYPQTAGILRERDYDVYQIDFTSLAESPSAWNPLDAVRIDPITQAVNEQDVASISAVLCPEEQADEPYWTQASRQFLSILITFCLRRLVPEEHDLSHVCMLLSTMDDNTFSDMMADYAYLYPHDPLNIRWRTARTVMRSEKTWSCIGSMISERLDLFNNTDAQAFFHNSNKIRFSDLGERKTALYLNISDADRSVDRLISLLYTQLMQMLIRDADAQHDGCLQVPCVLMLDDFAAGTQVPDMANLMACIRSRGISAMLAVQTLPQLSARYGYNEASTILSCCDTMLYMGGRDYDTAEEIARQCNLMPASILNLPVTQCVLMQRGQPARIVLKYQLESHPLYKERKEEPTCRTISKKTSTLSSTQPAMGAAALTPSIADQ